MYRSNELVAGQRHAALLAEAAKQRLVEGKWHGAGEIEPTARNRSWRLFPGRLLPAR